MRRDQHGVTTRRDSCTQPIYSTPPKTHTHALHNSVDPPATQIPSVTRASFSGIPNQQRLRLCCCLLRVVVFCLASRCPSSSIDISFLSHVWDYQSSCVVWPPVFAAFLWLASLAVAVPHLHVRSGVSVDGSSRVWSVISADSACVLDRLRRFSSLSLPVIKHSRPTIRLS